MIYLIQIILAIIISVILLRIGVILAKITDEEQDGFYPSFMNAMIGISASIIFIISFLLNNSLKISYLLTFLILITLFFVNDDNKRRISIIIYFLSAIILVKNFDLNLLAITIINGLIIGSTFYTKITRKKQTKMKQSQGKRQQKLH